MPTTPPAPETRVFTLGTGYFNAFLYRQDGRLTLIDGGLPAFRSQLDRTLESLGASIKDIEAILLTHGHLDHVGIVEQVRRDSGAEVFLHPADGAMAARGGRQLPPTGLLLNSWRPPATRLLAHAAIRRVFFAPGIQKFTPIEASGSLDVPGQPEVLVTPGHTDGSLSFWFPESRDLFAGDALVTVDMFRGGATRPQITPWRTNVDQVAALRSLDAFAELGQARLYTGHGEIWEGQMSEAVKLARDTKRLAATGDRPAVAGQNG